MKRISKTQKAKTLQKFAASCFLFAFCFFPFMIKAQSAINVGGIVTAHYLDGGDGASPLRHNDGLPGFEWVGDLFLNVRVSDEASVFLELETWRGIDVRLYSGSLTYKISGDRLKVEAGKFVAPFGNFQPRRFAPHNFVYGYPLFYEYRTALTANSVPRSRETLLGARGGANRDDGLALIARQAYISGAQFFGKLGPFGYNLGLANGALCNPTTVSEGKQPMVFGRLHAQPAIGLTLGASAASGIYLNRQNIAPDLQPDKHRQNLFGVDLEYSRGYLVFFGEGAFSRWQSPRLGESLEAMAFSAELRYKIMPRLFIAARYGRINFSKISDAQDVDADGQLTEPWEFPLWRLESALGYNLSRHALLKAVWQLNRTDAPHDPADNLAAIQMTVFY